MRPGLFRPYRTVALLFLIVNLISHAGAQDNLAESDSLRKDAVRIFMDCRGCDMNYIREEIPYVNYVRDVTQADLYVLITRQNTGSGGRNYTLYYTGQERFTGMNDTTDYSSSPDDTDDVTREGLTNTIAMGLMRYVMKTPVKKEIDVNYVGMSRQNPVEVADKWNYWVFSIRTRPSANIEKKQKRYSISNNFSASRVTEQWKINFRFNHSYNNTRYIFETADENDNVVTQTVEAVRSSWEVNGLLVKSLSDHWSLGGRSVLSSSTYNNLKFQARVTPAIEYNIFPYSVSNYKQLVFNYGIGLTHNNYNDTTIFEKTYEQVVQQELQASFEVQQRWGSVNIWLGASDYVHDFSKFMLQLGGFFQFRLFKGFSLSLNGNINYIRNQIELPKGQLSEEDVYLRLRELDTSYRYEGGIGITYTFGSIFNNVVNTRF